MADRDPWIKFRPDYWMNDPELRSCSGRARGALIDTICVMHYASSYGFLTVNGAQADLNVVAKQLVWRPSEYKKAIEELLEKGALHRNEAGIIYSPRLVSDWQKRQVGKATGTLGGNPALKGQTVNPPPITGTVNPEIEREKEKEIEREGEPLTLDGPCGQFINYWCNKIGPLVLDSDTSCRLGDIHRNFSRELPPGAKPADEILRDEIDELAKRPPSKRNVKYFEGMLWGKLNEE